MASDSFHVRQATRDDAEWMQKSFSKRDPRRQAGYFEEMALQQDAGLLALLVAETDGGAYAGHVKVLWEAEYSPFRSAGIPEIQDLFVLQRYRRLGVATRLLDLAEHLVVRRLAGQSSTTVPRAGIAVGLYAEYGPAQRLYVRRGYIPDGRGAHYRKQPIRGGQILPFDDEAVLYLVKTLHH